MKIKRYFKLKKEDSLIASNVEKKLFVVETKSRKLKVYKEGDLYFEIKSDERYSSWVYSTQYTGNGSIIVYNIKSGFIDEIYRPTCYGLETIFHQKGDYIYEINTVNRSENKRFYLHNNTFEYLPIIEGSKRGLIITMKTKIDDHFVINIYSQNIQKPIFTHILSSEDDRNSIFYTTTDRINGELYIRFKKITRRYANTNTLMSIKFEEVFNPVPFKGEYK